MLVILSCSQSDWTIYLRAAYFFLQKLQITLILEVANKQREETLGF